MVRPDALGTITDYGTQNTQTATMAITAPIGPKTNAAVIAASSDLSCRFEDSALTNTMPTGRPAA